MQHTSQAAGAKKEEPPPGDGTEHGELTSPDIHFPHLVPAVHRHGRVLCFPVSTLPVLLVIHQRTPRCYSWGVNRSLVSAPKRIPGHKLGTKTSYIMCSFPLGLPHELCWPQTCVSPRLPLPPSLSDHFLSCQILLRS